MGLAFLETLWLSVHGYQDFSAWSFRCTVPFFACSRKTHHVGVLMDKGSNALELCSSQSDTQMRSCHSGRLIGATSPTWATTHGCWWYQLTLRRHCSQPLLIQLIRKKRLAHSLLPVFLGLGLAVLSLASSERMGQEMSRGGLFHQSRPDLIAQGQCVHLQHATHFWWKLHEL